MMGRRKEVVLFTFRIVYRSQIVYRHVKFNFAVTSLFTIIYLSNSFSEMDSKSSNKSGVADSVQRDVNDESRYTVYVLHAEKDISKLKVLQSDIDSIPR